MIERQTFTGKVVKKPWGVGSKSEHQAVMLVTKEKEYILREMGANPFQNSKLDNLVGQEVTLEGQILNDYVFLIGKL